MPDSQLALHVQRQEQFPADTLLAACRCFAKTGFHGTTLRAIAQEAGVPLGSLHYHFGNKEKVYRAVIEFLLSVARDLGEKIDAALNELKSQGVSEEERVTHMFAMYVDFHFDNPEFSKIALHQMAEFDIEAPLKNMHEVIPVDDYAINKMGTFFGTQTDERFRTQVMASNMVITGLVGASSYHKNMLGEGIDDDTYRKLVTQSLVQAYSPNFLRRS
ncbi:MAG: TetR/AcrR family transcriptional regulator [Pseudomonadota bacterium]